MPNVQPLSSAGIDTFAEVVERLPFPVLVAERRSGRWTVTALNAASRALVTHGDAVGRPLGEALDLGAGGTDSDSRVEELLDHVAETGQPLGGRRVELVADRSVRAALWLSLTPVADEEGVRAVIVTLLDDAGEGAGGRRRVRRDALRAMATDLKGDRPLRQILAEAATEAAQTAGAHRVAIMLSDGREEFSVVASAGDRALPQRFHVPETAEALIDVAWGRSRLAWSSRRPNGGAAAAAAIPFLGRDGWEQALVVGMRIRGGGFGLVAVGDPVDGDWDDGALERLELAGVLLGVAVEGAQLRGEFARLEELLQAAVRTSGGLVGHTNPANVRRRLVEGIVADMQMAGAALWLPDTEGTQGAVLVAQCGLPDDVRERVAKLPPGDAVTAAAAGERPWHIRSDATSARAWEGHHLHVVPVPDSASGALGVYSEEPLPSAAAEVFASLAQALASAVHQTTLHRRASSVVEALQRQLQPRTVELAPRVEVGHVYQSAAAGVPIGGDFVDVFTTATGHIGLACGDVSGKGIEAATLSAMAVYSLRAFALQGAMPRIVMSLMNAAVEAQTGDDRFLTMVYARIQPREWTVELACAGHPPPILVGPDGARAVTVAADVPVGMMGTSVYREDAFFLPDGHSLVLYTDGVTEARSGHDQQRSLFGLDRLVAALDGLRDAHAQGMAEGVWEAVQQWAAGETTDDCAVVVLRRAS